MSYFINHLVNGDHEDYGFHHTYNEGTRKFEDEEGIPRHDRKAPEKYIRASDMLDATHGRWYFSTPKDATGKRKLFATAIYTTDGTPIQQDDGTTPPSRNGLGPWIWYVGGSVLLTGMGVIFYFWIGNSTSKDVEKNNDGQDLEEGRAVGAEENNDEQHLEEGRVSEHDVKPEAKNWQNAKRPEAPKLRKALDQRARILKAFS